MEKIEATYEYLRELSSGTTGSISAPSHLNQDLINLTDKVKAQQGGEIDYEMVMLCLLAYFLPFIPNNFLV